MFTIRVRQRGDWKKTTKFLTEAQRIQVEPVLRRYGEQGVTALSSATPMDSGATAMSWGYRILQDGWGYSIEWYNTNQPPGSKVSIAILIQYGHGTGTGGYVQPRDFINPVMIPIFDKMAEELWEEVRRL